MLTASIVIYHSPQNEIRALIDSVLQSSVEKLYLIDNSKNDALRCLESLSPRIRYIHNANIGYGGAHNIAIREAMELNSTYHVVINPDISFGNGVMEGLTDYMEMHSEVGLVMPRVENPDGSVRYVCKLLPSPFDLMIRRFLPKDMFKKAQEKFTLMESGYNKEMNVPFLSGCFMFLRIDALRKVGLFDERFFMYGEDVDLSRRIHIAYKTMYYPAVAVTHPAERASYRNWKMLRIHIINLIKYFNKWGWFFDGERRHINRHILATVSRTEYPKR